MSNTMTLYRKGESRIFVDKEENIKKVEDIMQKMNSYEFENYYPKGLVTVFKPENNRGDNKDYTRIETIYNHKFDELDMNELCARCWQNGIYVFVWYGESGFYKTEI